MPILPSSTKRPSGASAVKLSSSSSPARLLSTTSTPRPPVRSSTSAANPGPRELITCSTPIARRNPHLPALAVAKTSAPNRRASRTAACPTPPAAAWISTRSPAFKSARRHSP